MDKVIRGLKATRFAVAILFCILLSPAFMMAQKAERPAKNDHMQQMDVTKGNFNSFSVPHENLTGWAKFNKNTSHPEFGKLPFNAEYPGFVEVLEKRQVDERYFLNEKDPSEFRVQKGLGALHFKSNGQWITIDHRLTDKGNGIFEADQQFDPVGFDVKKTASYIKTPEGEVYFNRWKLFGTDKEGNEQLLAYANWSKYTAGEDGIYVTDIFPGMDARMQVYRGSVKTDFIVKSLQFANYKDLLFKDEFQSAAPAALKFAGYAAGSNRASSEVLLQSGKTNLLEIGEAIAYPQNGSKEQRIMPEYILEGNTLVTSVPVDWIQQYVNKTHVIIDPLVTSSNSLAQGSITGSMYNNNVGCTFAGASCNYNLSVNTPANATLTDVQWSFTYIAQGICYLEDGAVRFAKGACLSPSQSGFYWFCNAANPGTCAGTNISIWSDLSSCMPAPSCAPQAVTFTMQFFRDCFGATGCSNTCIGANSPWTMTLVGHTIEFTNTSTPITVSSNNICFGQNISASTTSQYGVPTYTYNWSFNSSGTPSVGTGTNPTISFPSPGTYTLYCIATDGCAQTTSASTVITVNPVPTLTVTPSANPICQGQNTTLNASGASTYTWNTGATGSSLNVTPGVGTTTYTVTGTSSGCSNTQTVSVSVNPSPAVTASANPTSICAGQTATLTAGGATSYTWSTGTVAGTETVSPGSTTTYTVTGDALGCQASQTVSVAVNPPPTLTITPSPANLCLGQTATLTASGAASYSWSSGGSNATETVTPGVNTTYTVTGTTSGCVSTQTVDVNVTPLPSLTVTATPASICTGQTTTLTVTGATTYTWSANSGGGNGNPIVVSPMSNITYTVAGTQGGCTDSTIISVNVGAQPVVSVSASDTTICSGQSTTLTATGASNYTWSSGGSASTETVTPNTTTTYTLIGDNGGCSDTTTFMVTVNATPTVTVGANPSSICTGTTATLTANGATTYTWSSGGTASTETVTPNSTTIYTVTGTTGNCSDSDTVSVNVTVQPAVAVSASDTTICSGQSTTLTATGANSYTWSSGGSASTETVTPNTTTTYTLIGNNGNCSDTTTFMVTVNATPTVTASAAPTAICSGQSSVLTASGAPSYTWSSGGTASTETVTPNSTTTYTLTGDSLGCTATQVVTVSVTTTPTVTALTPTTSVCSGQSVPLIAGGATTYTWSANAGGVTTQTVIVTPVNNPETYTVTGANGTCTGTATVSINVITTPTVSVSSSAPAICAGGSDTLTATVNPGASTISWSPGGATTSTLVVNSAGPWVCTVTNGGCTATQTVNVTVNPIPTLSAIASQTVCSGSNVSSINFSTSGGATVNWTNTNTSIGLAASGSGTIAGYQSPAVTGQQAGVINATPVDQSTGCTGSSQTFTITINPKPVVTGPALTDSALCGLPTGGVHNLTVSNGTPGYTYQWYTGITPVPGGSTLNLSNVSAGSYSLVVTDANLCVATSGPYTVGGTPLVIASFSASPTSGTAPLNVSFTNGSVGAVSWSWNFGNGQTSTGQNPNTTYETGGTYVVVLVASNGGCTSTDTTTIHVDQAISLVVPNVFSPNGDGINDEFSFTSSGITSLTCDIFNRWGQKVKTLNGPTDKWDGKLDNGHTASEGTYFYTVVASSFDNKPHNSQGYLTIVK